MNNVKDEARLRDDELRLAKNFVLDDEGEAQLRAGLVRKLAGTNVTGAFPYSSEEILAFDADELILANVWTWAKTTLGSGLSAGHPSVVRIGPRVFWTNGKEHGRVHVPTGTVLDGFGTPNPSTSRTLGTLSYGALPAGRYFVAVTYVDAFGEESGCSAIEFVELSTEGGIRLTLGSAAPAGVSEVRIYLSEVNGKRDELRRVQVLDASDTVTDILSREFGSPLDTAYLAPIPCPDLITAYNGHLFFSVGGIVAHSEPMRYGLFDADHGEVGEFPEDVTVLEAGFDGIWVVADRTYAYVGNLPKEFALRDDVFNFPAVKYSGKQLDGSLFRLEGVPNGDVPYWFSSRGGVIGLPGGNVLPVAKGRAEPEDFRVGVSGVVEFNGVESILTALDERRGPADAVTLQDTFTVKVIKRGISDE